MAKEYTLDTMSFFMESSRLTGNPLYAHLQKKDWEGGGADLTCRKPSISPHNLIQRTLMHTLHLELMGLYQIQSSIELVKFCTLTQVPICSPLLFLLSFSLSVRNFRQTDESVADTGRKRTLA